MTPMKTTLLIVVLTMGCVLAHGDESNSYEDCLTEAIRRSARAAHTSTSRCEAVMVEGMRVTFTNSNGGMTITCGKGFERSYTWDGDTRTLLMWPRKTRWYGSLGMYNPGACIEGELGQWKEHDGIKRCVAEEGQRHFTNELDAVEWIHTRGDGKKLDYVYNDSGLVCGMDKQPPTLEERKKTDFPGTLFVDLWQIYINGKKPRKLAGAKNNAITVSYPSAYDLETVIPPAQTIDNNYRDGKQP